MVKYSCAYHVSFSCVVGLANVDFDLYHVTDSVVSNFQKRRDLNVARLGVAGDTTADDRQEEEDRII